MICIFLLYPKFQVAKERFVEVIRMKQVQKTLNIDYTRIYTFTL